MPKFMYTIIVGALTFWIICLRVLNSVTPDSALSYIYFLLPFFGAVTLTLSIPIYFYFYHVVPTFTNLKALYRRSFKWAALAGLGITCLAVMKLFGLLTIINFILFVILYVAVFIQLRK